MGEHDTRTREVKGGQAAAGEVKGGVVAAIVVQVAGVEVKGGLAVLVEGSGVAACAIERVGRGGGGVDGEDMREHIGFRSRGR